MIGYLNKFYYKSTPKHFHDRDKHNVKIHDRIIIKVANNYGRPTVNNTTGLQIGQQIKIITIIIIIEEEER